MIYRIIAVVCLILFYSCYFGKMFLQRQKDIQTDQIGKNTEGFIKFIEITLKIVTIIVPIVEVISIFFLKTFINDTMQNIGAVCCILGVLAFILSVVEMKDNWRAGIPKDTETKLVTNGIYQISRNPAFLGFDLVYIGILLMYFNWLLFAVSAFAMIIFHLQIVNVEEDYLIASFGQEYVEYKKRVNRYLGCKLK